MEPTITTKAQLIVHIQAERARLDMTLAALSDAQMIAPTLAGGWSGKDILAHIAFWEQRMLTILAAAERGEYTPPIMLVGESFDAVNAQQYAIAKDRSLSEIRAMARQSFTSVIATLERLTEDDLFAPTGLARVRHEPILPLITGNTYEHYQEHREAIQAWLDAGN